MARKEQKKNQLMGEKIREMKQTSKVEIREAPVARKRPDPKHEQLSSKLAFPFTLVGYGANSFPIRNCRTRFCCRGAL